jgi:hypothetical protein
MVAISAESVAALSGRHPLNDHDLAHRSVLTIGWRYG